MKTSNFSIVVLSGLMLLCCTDPHPIPEEFVNPCQNGGTYVSGYFGVGCNCPEGWCGDLCDTRITQNLYGNYTGAMVCEGDSVITQFEVIESVCDPYNSQYFFNGTDLIAKYSKSFLTGVLEEGEIIVNHIGSEFYTPVNGRLTPDSLSFWVIEYENSPDTCFYVGVRD